MDNLSTRRSVSMTPGGQGGTRSGTNRVVRWAGMVIVLVSVLAVAVKVAFALTYAGPVTVTANMGSFSPNPVEVNNAVTANLSANYYPPSGVPEGDLSAQYNWSIGQVQYKALQADAYGSPPADSYTDSIAPTQPSASSGATLTFTPLIAGYWAVSVSCGVKVTDAKTGQYWSGSSNAGPQDLTSAQLTISPQTDTSAFLNTKNYVVVTVSPSDLVPDTTLTVTGGATFIGGVTSETMTSASEDVYFYGPNVYGSGGAASSGQLSATVNVPASSGPSGNAPSLAAAPAGSPGAALNASVTVNLYKLSDVGNQAVSTAISSLVTSGVNAFMAQLKSQENAFLEQQMASGSQNAEQATEEYYALNDSQPSGYSQITSGLTGALNLFQTGTQNSATPGSADAGLGPANTPTLPAFSPSAITSSSLTTTFTSGVNLPVLGPNWTMPAFKTGNFFSSVAEAATGTFRFGDLATGTWSAAPSLSFVQGFNNKITSQSVSVPIGFQFTSPAFPIKNANFGLTYTPSYNCAGDLKTTPFVQTVQIQFSFGFK